MKRQRVLPVARSAAILLMTVFAMNSQTQAQPQSQEKKVVGDIKVEAGDLKTCFKLTRNQQSLEWKFSHSGFDGRFKEEDKVTYVGDKPDCGSAYLIIRIFYGNGGEKVVGNKDGKVVKEVTLPRFPVVPEQKPFYMKLASLIRSVAGMAGAADDKGEKENKPKCALFGTQYLVKDRDKIYIWMGGGEGCPNSTANFNDTVKMLKLKDCQEGSGPILSNNSQQGSMEAKKSDHDKWLVLKTPDMQSGQCYQLSFPRNKNQSTVKIMVVNSVDGIPGADDGSFELEAYQTIGRLSDDSQ